MNRLLEAAAAKLKREGYSNQQIDFRLEMLDQSAAYHPAKKLQLRLERIRTSKIRAIPWPWTQVGQLAPCLLPGSVCVLAGSPGASKSFAVLQCLKFWICSLVQASVLMLEGTQAEHCQRILAQLEANCNLTDLEWLCVNASEANEAAERHFRQIDEVGQCIYEAGHISTYMDVLNWVEERCGAGDRIIVVDPITSADPEGRQWEADRMMVTTAHRLAEKFHTSIVFVSHPVKGHERPALDSLAGGAAYQRHADLVLWLEAIAPKTVTVASPCGRHETEIDRIMHLLKVRHGPGHGKRIGFCFDVQSLSLVEQGLILKDKKG